MRQKRFFKLYRIDESRISESQMYIKTGTLKSFIIIKEMQNSQINLRTALPDGDDTLVN